MTHIMTKNTSASFKYHRLTVTAWLAHVPLPVHVCRLNYRYSYVWKDIKNSTKIWADVPAECLFVCSENIHVTDSYSGI